MLPNLVDGNTRQRHERYGADEPHPKGALDVGNM
jgi:hypothetical protein